MSAINQIPCVFPDLEIDAYHSHPAISKSGLDKVSVSVAHYLEQRKTRPDKTHLQIGRALHTVVLEGEEKFRAQFAFPPFEGAKEDDWRSKEGKAWRDAHLEVGRIPLHYKDGADIARMCGALHRHQAAYEWLKLPGTREHSYFWQDADTGVLCRCRPDLMVEVGDMLVLVDLKTTQDARPDEFQRSCAKWRYGVQAAFYMDGVEAVTGRRPDAFMLVAVESSAPHGVGLYELGDVWVRRGVELYKRDLARWAAYQKTENPWEGYPEGITELEMPTWA